MSLLLRRTPLNQLLLPILLPLTLFYRAIVGLRHFAYKMNLFTTHRLPGQTISIGNIEVGGTGKSPVVVSLCQYLTNCGHSPAILTRGYGSGLKKGESLVLLDQKILHSTSETQNQRPDEAFMQSAELPKVPIIVGPDRYNNAQQYLKNFPQPSHWILDDGFQHLAIHRDTNIVLLDAQNPLHNGYCIPSGRLRESPNALNRASCLLFTRATVEHIAEKPLTKIPQKPHFFIPFRQNWPRNLKGQNLKAGMKHYTLVTAIAKPEILINNLTSAGISIVSTLKKRDHQSFTQRELDSAYKQSDGIITTAKDFARHPLLFNQKTKTFIAPVAPRITPEMWKQILSTKAL